MDPRPDLQVPEWLRKRVAEQNAGSSQFWPAIPHPKGQLWKMVEDLPGFMIVNLNFDGQLPVEGLCSNESTCISTSINIHFGRCCVYASRRKQSEFK